MDGLLRVMQVVAKDFTPCEQALLPVYDTITKAMDEFKSGVSGRAGKFSFVLFVEPLWG